MDITQMKIQKTLKSLQSLQPLEYSLVSVEKKTSGKPNENSRVFTRF